MAKLYDNILQTIGHTPVVKLNKLAPKGVNVYVKIEAFNPMGSVKDRLALGLIEDAEIRGELQAGQTIVEATSGNTGIGLAMVCAQKGYPLVLTMAENFSIERRKMMRFLGAKVVLTPASEKGTGMVAKARELAEKHGWWQPKQFENPANADTHARTTAVEILEDFSEIGLDYWVSGFGTGGTLNGVSRTLKEKSPDTRIVVCEPDNSQMLSSGVNQKRNEDGSHSESHPHFRPHLMQGWSPDFIPKLAEEVCEKKTIDAFLPIDGNEALRLSNELASKEGIFVGISAGATLAGALRVAEMAPGGSNILCMLPDTGERYLSTPLFEEVAVEMTPEEMEISQSTENYRFDLSAATAEVKIKKQHELDKAASAEVASLLADKDKPIVFFALEWCEFCWSVRKLFKKYNIEFVSVDIDALKYKENNLGQHIREVLNHKTQWNTFPQIFIGGEFIGGCIDIFERLKDGRLDTQLSKLNIDHKIDTSDNPYDFLPAWLHPR